MVRHRFPVIPHANLRFVRIRAGSGPGARYGAGLISDPRIQSFKVFTDYRDIETWSAYRSYVCKQVEFFPDPHDDTPVSGRRGGCHCPEKDRIGFLQESDIVLPDRFPGSFKPAATDIDGNKLGIGTKKLQDF